MTRSAPNSATLATTFVSSFWPLPEAGALEDDRDRLDDVLVVVDDVHSLHNAPPLVVLGFTHLILRPPPVGNETRWEATHPPVGRPAR